LTSSSSSFAVAYARFLPPVTAKCRRLLGPSPAAEDVAHEAFLRLWKSDVKDGDTRTVVAWLYRTCTRLAIDVLRDRRRSAVGEIVAEAVPCSLDVRTCAEARAAIALLASSVQEDELEVAVLCRVDGLSQEEAGAVLGVSDRTVRRLLARFDERIGPLRKEFAS
jgi:RNA polymerase sigma-70 factor (ECF subfamily)